MAYEIFEGNKFEWHTMLPVIEAFKQQYGLGRLVIIADSGLLSKQNIEQLQSQGYEFILGAHIKNEPAHIREQILSLRLENGESASPLNGLTTANHAPCNSLDIRSSSSIC